MPAPTDNASSGATPPKKAYVRAVGPRLRVLLLFIFGLVGVLAANSVYLGAITFIEWLKAGSNQTYQNWFYMVMFGAHLALGLLLVVPVVVFGAIHIKNAHDRPNRRAVKVGYLLFSTSLVVLVTGLLLTRIDIFQFKNVGLRNPQLRSIAYWAHVVTPVLAVRSEEHTSELQSRPHLVCRLLLEKKKTRGPHHLTHTYLQQHR